MEAKCVMFDCGGVLVSDMSWDLIINASEKDKQADVEAAIKEQWALMRVDPNYSESSFWIAMQKAGGISDEKATQLQNELREAIKLSPETLELAKRLRNELQLTIGIISNHSKFWFNYFVEKYKFSEVFTQQQIVIPSCDVYCAKPSRQIYEAAFERLKEKDPSLKPENVVFIDDKAKNVEAAKEFGFKGIQFCSFESDISQLISSLKENGVHISQ